MSEEIKEKEKLNFIEEIIEEDIRTGKNNGLVYTRFPPEPNGYLHIGHAKSICLNFGLGLKYQGKTNLRFDDTNPTKEDIEYVDSIREDVSWLGFKWTEQRYASDYFEQIYQLTLKLIKKGLAYIDDSTSEEIATMKGTPTQPGTISPYFSRTVAENLDLFERMRKGEFADGTRILRARIDMTSPNMHMRDPVIYRIKHAHHHQTGDAWCLYPMYDYAHPISDAIEGITHSVCTLEFEVHRPFYDWTIQHLELFPSRQIEFARLNLTYTVMSKRKLLRLVQDKLVNGWNDPRMPTISGLRRRGYTPASLREFANRIGIAKRDNTIDVSLLEFCIREDLNAHANRVMAVVNPMKVVITNYPKGQTDHLEVENNPEDPNSGTRIVPFSRTLWMEHEDFMENPPKKYFRMTPGGIVRLKGAYIIRCIDVEKDAEGNILQVNCEYIENSRSGSDTSGLSPKGTVHWVSAEHAIEAEARLYDRLFVVENPESDKDKDYTELLNPDSLKVLNTIYIEPSLKFAKPETSYQFIRNGYFCVDSDSTDTKLVFNRTVTLKDAWGKAK
jgi:glutaminyl-tRNA synthetase